jgi:hypothetical protein
MVLQFPASFANRLEMLRQIEAIEEEKRTLTEEGERKDRAVQQKESLISSLREDARTKEEQKSAEIDQLKLAHSSEVEQLRLQIRDLNTQKQLAAAKMEAEVAEWKSNATVYKSLMETSSRALFQEQEQFKQKIAQEREANMKLIVDNQNLQSENTNLLCTISGLQADTAEKDGIIKMKDTAANRMDSELEAKSRALGEKDATISAMSEQITKTREYLATKQQVSILMHA